MYYWYYKNNDSSPVSVAKGVTLPQFSIVNVSFVDKLEILSTGNYSRLACLFSFRRNIGFYVIQIYLPSQMIVIISWVSFWLSRDATPARVALGVLTVLTMTQLMTTTNNGLPKVSYIKSIDIYLVTCYWLVFSALVEYACVCYLTKIQKRRREKRAALRRPSHVNAVGDSSISPLLQNAAFLNVLNAASGRGPQPTAIELEGATRLASRIRRRIIRSTRELSITPSHVDKYSRVLFPVFFMVFNSIYWGVYLKITSPDEKNEYE